MKFRFSLRAFLIAISVVSVALYLAIRFWPHQQVPGDPNLFGKLTDKQGNPVSGAVVGIYDFDPSPWGPSKLPRYETTTDRNGAYRLRSAKLSSDEPINYLGLSFDRDGFENGCFFIKVDHATHSLANSIDRSGFNGICWQNINLIKDFDYRIDLKMIVGGVVSGCLKTGNGRPIGNSRIRFVSQKQNGYFRTYTTDEFGKFKTNALAPGDFDVELEHLGYSKLDELDPQEFPEFEDSELADALRASDDRASYDQIVNRRGGRDGFHLLEKVTINANQPITLKYTISMEDWLNGFPATADPEDETPKRPFGPRRNK